MHTVYAAHSPLSPHDTAAAYREAYGAPQSQSAPFVSYDERGHLVNYAYEGVPTMQFHGHQSGQETYAKHPQAPVYADAAAPKTYSPLLLDALPSLRREPVGGENYAVERAEGEVRPSQWRSMRGGMANLDTPRTHALRRYRRRTGMRATSSGRILRRRCRTSIIRSPSRPSPESISPTTGGVPRRCSSSRLRRGRHLPLCSSSSSCASSSSLHLLALPSFSCRSHGLPPLCITHRLS
ncbi:hypothetical protein B0H14DRAFT_2902123, partial [Mycena olivaceomarginata]